MHCTSDLLSEPYPPQDHLACGVSIYLLSSRSAVQVQGFWILVYELTAGQVGTGSVCNM